MSDKKSVTRIVPMCDVQAALPFNLPALHFQAAYDALVTAGAIEVTG